MSPSLLPSGVATAKETAAVVSVFAVTPPPPPASANDLATEEAGSASSDGVYHDGGVTAEYRGTEFFNVPLTGKSGHQ